MSQPELLIVARQGADDPMVRSVVAQFVEHGIWFAGLAEQSLPTTLPSDLAGYRGVVLDDGAAQEAVADPATRARLEAFAATGGVFKLDHMDPRDGGEPTALKSKIMVDVTAMSRAHDIMVHTGVTARHPEATRIQTQRPNAEIGAAVRNQVVRHLVAPSGWGEFTMHDWKAALALINRAGQHDLIPLLEDSVRRTCQSMPSPLHHDPVAGLFAAAWLKDHAGVDEPLAGAVKVLDEVITRRPRNRGLITGMGFVDDPLGFRMSGEDPLIAKNFVSSSSRRDTIWTEGLHMYGASFAAVARATGESRYLDEVMGMVDHFSTLHLRPDGLLAHVTRDGHRVCGTWSRGQGHALMGLLYILDEVEPDSPAAGRCIRLIDRVGRGLLPHQDAATGLWRNLIDHPDARLESSGTAAFVTVYARAINEGWLDRQYYEGMVRKGWDGLKRLYWREGLAGSCRGTGAGFDSSYYLARPQGWMRTPHLAQAWAEIERMG